MKKQIPFKTYLSESELPKQWYNIQADLPEPLDPPLSPATKKPVGPDDLSAIFPMELIMQEVSTERYIDIPKEVMEMYAMMRPSPLCRAYGLEKALGTPAHIYYKYEGNNPSGSHKLNSAIPQVYYNKIAGIKNLTTETGAGQWGTALSVACKSFDVGCQVFMVRVSSQQKPYRKIIMQTYGAEVIESPSERTEIGKKLLESPDNYTGSLGMAISEAVEIAAASKDTNYSLGSVLNHVCLHQSIIGLEAKLQFEKIDEYPDVVIGCCGGGSNFSGTVVPFLKDKLEGKNVRLVGVEPAACPSLTRGVYAYDYGDAVGAVPLLKMYTLGHAFVPAGIHAGGLRYHGMGPLMSKVHNLGLIEAKTALQSEIFEAGLLFANTEMLIPAPESCHAIKGAIDEAMVCKESGEKKVILFTLSGNGYFDMAAYDGYLSGNAVDFEFTDSMLEESIKCLPKVD
ncbi:MAG: TrpB-like pyridoxal phosphate-dependent enzyme [Christensenellales bacterium]